MLENQLQQFPPQYMVLLVISLWILVCILVSAIGGWRELAKDYRADFPFEGKKFRMKSGRMRWGTNYTACINFGANKMGLYLSMALFLRIGHPPLFIPWPDVEREETKQYQLIKTVRLKFPKHPNIPLFISKRLAERIFDIQDKGLTNLSIEPR